MQYVLTNSGGELNQLLAIDRKIVFKDWLKLANQINKIKQKEDYTLPWHEIDVGIKESFLRKEYEIVQNGEITPWCETNGCYNCGSCK